MTGLLATGPTAAGRPDTEPQVTKTGASRARCATVMAPTVGGRQGAYRLTGMHTNSADGNATDPTADRADHSAGRQTPGDRTTTDRTADSRAIDDDAERPTGRSTNSADRAAPDRTADRPLNNN